MKTVKRSLATLLSAAMLGSMVPAWAAAPAPVDTDQVIYNLKDHEVTVGVGGDESFAADGSYEIRLEDNAYFPYEVQFTDDGKTWEEWFMDPEDTVDVGGHIFSVTSDRTDPYAVTRFGMQVGEQYVPAYPEQKTFSAAPQPSLFSVLEEDNYYSVDLSNLFPYDLMDITLKTVLAEVPELGADPAVSMCCKYYYEDENGQYHNISDDFKPITINDPVNLYDYSGYSDSIYCDIIVGNQDQLDPANKRYTLYIRIPSADNLLQITAVSQADRNKTLTLRDSFSHGTMSGKPICWADAVVKDAEVKANDTVYVSLGLKNGVTTGEVKVYEGVYYTEAELQNAKLMTNIWSQDLTAAGAGYPLVVDEEHKWSQDSNVTVTVQMKNSDGTSSWLIPMNIRVELEGIYVGTEDLKNQTGESVRYDTDYNWDSEQHADVRTITLKNGYAVNGQYLLTMSASRGSQRGVELIRKAVLGCYQNENAIPAGAVDLKDQLFTTGYQADFSQGVAFTTVDILGSCERWIVKTQEYHRDIAISFNVNGVKDHYQPYVMRSDSDSFYNRGYQTVFISDLPADTQTIVPYFNISDGCKVYAGHNGSSGNLQISGESSVAFENVKPVPYTVVTEDGQDSQNFWVTFITPVDNKPQLYVNAANDDSRKDDSGAYVRECYLDRSNNYMHDIFFANIGSMEMKNMDVRLENAQNIYLDDFWTIRADGGKTLPGMLNDNMEDCMGKIRIHSDPAVSGPIAGTLVISHDAGTEFAEEVKVKLTGYTGTLKITTETVEDGVKFVPYSNVIQTNNNYADTAVVFNLVDGKLPAGVELRPNGEIYGVPTETGDFTFTVRAALNSELFPSDVYGLHDDTHSYTLTIKDDTRANVEASTDEGYTVLDRIPNHVTGAQDEMFRSEGTFGEFVDCWLDGQKLVADTDYVAEEGSTKITIRTQTLKKVGLGSHVLAAEFRTDGDRLNGAMKRAAQVFTVGGGSSAGDRTPIYNINVPKTDNGSVSMSASNASKGDTVFVTIAPKEGFELSELTIVTKRSGKEVEVTPLGGNKFSFVMPSEQIEIKAKFTKQEPTSTDLPYVDVSDQDWFHDCVRFVMERGIMIGVSENQFAPEISTSRAMLLTMLYRMAGEPAADGELFDDVAEGQYYTEAVRWAAANGIAHGCGDGKLCPNDDMTREQMVIMLMNFAKYQGVDLMTRGELAKFVDADQISEEAKPAISWAVSMGLVRGRDNNVFAPLDTATRAEVAQVIANYLNAVENAEQR